MAPYLVGLDGPGLHVQIPDLHRQVVAGHQVAPAVAELDVGDRRDDLGEEGAVVWILWLFEH